MFPKSKGYICKEVSEFPFLKIFLRIVIYFIKHLLYPQC